MHTEASGISSVGRAAASQAAGHEFEPRIPLFFYVDMSAPGIKKLVISNEEMFSRVDAFLSQGRIVTIPVKGLSMLPFIVGERDLAVLEKSEVYKKDDIVLFCLGGRWILHRIIGFEADGAVAVIRGDGVLSATEHCPMDKISGKVVTLLRKGKKPINPYSGMMKLALRVWNFFRPLRRYILYIYRHLPWMRKYFADI